MTKLLFKIIESYLLVHIFNSIQEVKRFSSWFAEMKAITRSFETTTINYLFIYGQVAVEVSKIW